jgi:plasmid stabilization system protein ParE
MSDYHLTPLAKADIFEIWLYIAEDTEAAAVCRLRVRGSVTHAWSFS